MAIKQFGIPRKLIKLYQMTFKDKLIILECQRMRKHLIRSHFKTSVGLGTHITSLDRDCEKRQIFGF